MSPSLPEIMILKSSHPERKGRKQIPFCVRHCNARDLYKHILLCNIYDIASPHAKFQLITVDADKGLYNIRCCYNNKLWTSSASGLIQATEKEAAGNATLFKFEPVDVDNHKYRLMYMENEDYVCFNYKALYAEREWVLETSSPYRRDQSHDVFTVVNWDSLVILPKEVAFKGPNGKYIYAMTDRNDYYYFRVISDDIGDRQIMNEIVTLSDRRIAVYNLFRSKYWTYDDYNYQHGGTRIYVVPQTCNICNAASQFEPIKIDRNVIALRNVKLGTYCIWSKRGDYFLVSDNPDATRSDETKFQVEELVVSRKIYNVDFRFDDSLIYNDTVIVNVSDQATNKLDKETKEELNLKYEATQSSSYDTGTSVKTISGFSLEGSLPVFTNALAPSKDSKKVAAFKPSAEYTDEKENKYSWGQSIDKKSEIRIGLSVTVPPKTKVTAEMDVREAKCDIPFSYTQRDITTKGEHIVQAKEDGVYNCTNCYYYSIIINQQEVK